MKTQERIQSARARILSRTSRELSAVSGQPLTRGDRSAISCGIAAPRVKGQRSATPQLLALSCQLLAKSATRLPARSHPVLNPEPRTLNPSRVPAFTLTELLVVLAILALIATLAVPAMGPMFASNQTASAMSTISAMLVTAQATARANGTPVGLRIERAYKTDDRGFLVNASGQTAFDMGFRLPGSLKTFPFVPLDHQQIRMVTFSPGKQQAFVVDKNIKPVPLPKDIWVAPGELPSNPVDLLEAHLSFTPAEGVPYNLLDTFFIVFNSSGELIRYPADQCLLLDDAQMFFNNKGLRVFPAVASPNPSSRSVLLYDRSKWDGIPTTDGVRRLEFLTRSGVPVYINRTTGGVVEEKR